MATWPTKLSEYAVPHILGHKAVIPRNHAGTGILIGADNFAVVFGVEAGRQRRLTRQIAEHHCELSAYRFGAIRRQNLCAANLIRGDFLYRTELLKVEK